MSRSIRVPQPTPQAPPDASDFEKRVADYLSKIERAINGLPAFSIFSGNPNTSGISANAGTVGFDIAASATSRLWVNQSGTTSGWSFVNYV